AFLISEAVRGEGAILLNDHDEPFMKVRHPLADLAPRDVVAREIFREMKKSGASHVRLSLSHLDPERIRHRFPTITAYL
ncbi:FAD-binding protein, partial [Klebsiella pneumoniae]|nr:FAD-binding protein [Klebsiella pneumoniae]